MSFHTKNKKDKSPIDLFKGYLKSYAKSKGVHLPGIADMAYVQVRLNRGGPKTPPSLHSSERTMLDCTYDDPKVEILAGILQKFKDSLAKA
jgi:hypothetical protein